MPHLPSDILCEILLRLPAESLVRFRSVCKAWRRLIDDPSFIQSHTQSLQPDCSTLLIRYPYYLGGRLYYLSLDSLNYTDDGPQTVDLTPVKQLISRDVPRIRKLPLPSCNGLILLAPQRNIDRTWAIWNPSTQGFRKLIVPDSFLRVLSNAAAYDYQGSWSCGFGYDYTADDYKVVRIDRICRRHIRALVYSLKTRSWRMIKDCPYGICLKDNGVFWNGALHWPSYPDGVVALHLGTEDYSLLPPIPTELGLQHLDVLGGSFVLSGYDRGRMNGRLDGWVMEDWGVEKPWVKLFSVAYGTFPDLRPVAYLKSKRQVLLQSWRGFLWVDAENNSVKKVTVDGSIPVAFSQFCPGSLVRLDDSGSVGESHDAARRTAQAKRKRKRKRDDTSLTFHVEDTK